MSNENGSGDPMAAFAQRLNKRAEQSGFSLVDRAAQTQPAVLSAAEKVLPPNTVKTESPEMRQARLDRLTQEQLQQYKLVKLIDLTAREREIVSHCAAEVLALADQPSLHNSGLDQPVTYDEANQELAQIGLADRQQWPQIMNSRSFDGGTPEQSRQVRALMIIGKNKFNGPMCLGDAIAVVTVVDAAIEKYPPVDNLVDRFDRIFQKGIVGSDEAYGRK